MRVSSNMFFNANAISSQRAQTLMLKAQQQLSSNSKLQTAADNPTDAVQVMRTNQNLAEADQYRSASRQAQTRLELSEGGLSSMSSMVVRARELAVQLGNDSLSTGARQAIGKEAASLLQSMVAAANSKDANGESAYAGYLSKVSPVGQDVSGNWVYQSDDNIRRVRISNTRDLPASVPASAIFFDPSTPLADANGYTLYDSMTGQPLPDSIFATLKSLVDLSQTPANTSVGPGVQGIMQRIGNFSDRILTARADVGAMLGEVEAAQNAFDDSDLYLKTYKSGLQDIDLAEAITRFTQQQTVLQATQQSFTRIQGLSLFNYLQ
jgi:flagellar hook-associated protein 3 FlgL